MRYSKVCVCKHFSDSFLFLSPPLLTFALECARTETLNGASKEVSLEINIEKTVYFAVPSPECRSKSGHENDK
jgi:hypothetical protein